MVTLSDLPTEIMYHIMMYVRYNCFGKQTDDDQEYYLHDNIVTLRTKYTPIGLTCIKFANIDQNIQNPSKFRRTINKRILRYPLTDANRLDNLQILQKICEDCRVGQVYTRYFNISTHIFMRFTKNVRQSTEGPKGCKPPNIIHPLLGLLFDLMTNNAEDAVNILESVGNHLIERLYLAYLSDKNILLPDTLKDYTRRYIKKNEIFLIK
jgi:hypothetical protein